MARLMTGFKLFLLIMAFSTINGAYSADLFNIFSNHLNPTFIAVNNKGNEIGVVNKALRAGFPDVFVIEVSQYGYEADFFEFATNPRVHLLFGNSTVVLLQNTLNNLQRRERPATIWIDDAVNSSIIKDELNAILNTSHNNRNTIIIDHIEQYSRQDRAQFKQILKAINRNYNFSDKNINENRQVLIASP